MSVTCAVQAKKPDSRPLERRRDDGDVVQVAGAFPRVVGDVDIAFEHVLTPDAADEMGQPHRPLR
jgi:hypothetical protein